MKFPYYMGRSRLRFVTGMQVRRFGWRFSMKNRKSAIINTDAWAVDMRRLKREKRRAKQRAK